MLNLPDVFTGRSNILLCGIGGGFDCFCAVPLYEALTKMGHRCFISSYNIQMNGAYYGDNGNKPNPTTEYEPEELLRASGYPCILIWKRPPRALEEVYKKIVHDYNIDHIVMMDGGVDSLMQGNEVRKGTIAEEFTNFAALQDIRVKKTLVSIGFGCEREEEISHYRTLENMAALTKKGYFLGTCALTPQMEEFQKYKAAYEKVKDYLKHKRSHIHPRIIAAIEGQFGEVAVKENTIMQETKSVLISPLMSILWFFDGDGVIKSNVILPALKNCNTFLEVIMMLRDAPQERDNRVIPY